MDLRLLDIRLLLLFDMLIQEQNVTRAAQRLHLTQSAASNALARLRVLFGDDLFVRGSNGMSPTPRALVLAPRIREALERLENITKAGEPFEPRKTTNEFAIRISDLPATLVLPQLLAYFHANAPKATLRVVDLPAAEIRQALDTNSIDIAIGRDISNRTALRAQTLFSDSLVCVMRCDHPAAGHKLSLKSFLKLRHIKFALNRGDDRSLDETIEKQGLKRDIALYVPYWLVLPQVICATDLAVVMSERLFRGFKDDRLTALSLPLDLRPHDFEILWHRRHDHDAPHCWLRQAIMHVTEHLDQR